VAHIVPITERITPEPVGAEGLADMERKGLIHRGTGRLDPALLKPPTGRPCGVLRALLAEREGR
jgi:hypothetical protein